MKVHELHVFPRLPELLRPLEFLARNLWFSWNWEAVRLFLRLDPEAWEKAYHNPIAMLGMLSPETLEAAAQDDSFVAELERVYEQFSKYLARTTWFQETYPAEDDFLVAYFSMEYGLDEGLPIYSGGLGILSGDHLKSASDLGVPLVGVGLLYQRGYLQQRLNLDGWQQEHYTDNDWYRMPVTLEKDAAGHPVKVSVDLAGDRVWAQVWRVQVGRTPLYLLDTNLPENPPQHRGITGQLYGGDRDMRIRQEIVLGIGGGRALDALGLRPTVYHMNEGHSAFLALERIRSLMSRWGLTFDQARELVWATNVFTTHTPVPAGNEHFDPNLVRKYLEPLTKELGISWSEFLALGQEEPGVSPTYCLTVLALKLSAFCNGVSRLHGSVSRNMWRKLWPGLPEPEIPISHITNGIHTRTWISHDMAELYDRYLGPKFVEEPADQKVWERVDLIPDGELWRVHEIRKERLIAFARRRLREYYRRQGASLQSIQAAEEVLDPHALTIGFARRFAAYKRADLILKDPDRLRRILTNPERPVQIIFAGKAHPQDNDGKELIRRIIHFARDPGLRRHIVFLEDYDLAVARYMVQGVDVWLNNPRRPLEASGTSGMKAAANGAINVSILDGWWDEAYRPGVGWAIGSGEVYADPAEQDYVESQLLYELLENEIVPLFYDRDKIGLPRGWIRMMKASIKSLAGYFNTHRMVREYTERFYLTAHHYYRRLFQDNGAPAKRLAEWRRKVSAQWSGVSVVADGEIPEEGIKTGDRIQLKAVVRVGQLTKDDVTVQAVVGPMDSQGQILIPEVHEMEFVGQDGDALRYQCEIECTRAGRLGYAVRVLPHHPDLVHPFTPVLVAWES